jgi:hypothetical protein
MRGINGRFSRTQELWDHPSLKHIYNAKGHRWSISGPES